MLAYRLEVKDFNMNKRQYTRTLYQIRMGRGYIRVSYIYNKSTGNRKDVIQLELLNEKQEYTKHRMRVDEAVIIAGGLTWAAGLKLGKMIDV